MNSFQKSKYPNKEEGNLIRDISDINAYSTPKQISQFVGLKMKEFIKNQLDGKIEGKEKSDVNLKRLK